MENKLLCYIVLTLDQITNEIEMQNKTIEKENSYTFYNKITYHISFFFRRRILSFYVKITCSAMLHKCFALFTYIYYLRPFLLVT